MAHTFAHLLGRSTQQPTPPPSRTAGRFDHLVPIRPGEREVPAAPPAPSAAQVAAKRGADAIIAAAAKSRLPMDSGLDLPSDTTARGIIEAGRRRRGEIK